MRDITKAQAAQWAAQEFEKCDTPEKQATRLATEKAMLRIDLPGLPNSRLAHEQLVAKLEALNK